MIKLIENVLQSFILTCPDFVQQMQQTTHHVVANPVRTNDLCLHHLEGSVWNHVLLMLCHLRNTVKYKTCRSDSTHPDHKFMKNIIMAIICHDVGKHATKKIERGNGKKKATFRKHENVSAFILIDITERMQDQDYDTKLLFRLVYFHMIFCDKDANALYFKNLDSQFYEAANLLNECDCKGRYTQNTKKYDIPFQKPIIDTLTKAVLPAQSDTCAAKLKHIHLVMSLPHSGVDAYIKKQIRCNPHNAVEITLTGPMNKEWNDILQQCAACEQVYIYHGSMHTSHVRSQILTVVNTIFCLERVSLHAHVILCSSAQRRHNAQAHMKNYVGSKEDVNDMKKFNFPNQRYTLHWQISDLHC